MIANSRATGASWSKLDALDARKRLPRVSGAADHQLAELDQAALAQPDKMENAAKSDQRLRRADVVRGLLAADVLLAGLQGKDEAAAAVDVVGLAGDASRHAADVLLRRAEEAERRPAVIEATAERLTFADRNVDAAVAGRDGGHRASSGRPRRTPWRPHHAPRRQAHGQVFDAAEEVRVLDEDGGGLIVKRSGELGGVGEAVLEADLDHLGAKARARRCRASGGCAGEARARRPACARPFVVPRAR